MSLFRHFLHCSEPSSGIISNEPLCLFFDQGAGTILPRHYPTAALPLQMKKYNYFILIA